MIWSVGEQLGQHGLHGNGRLLGHYGVVLYPCRSILAMGAYLGHGGVSGPWGSISAMWEYLGYWGVPRQLEFSLYMTLDLGKGPNQKTCTFTFIRFLVLVSENSFYTKSYIITNLKKIWSFLFQKMALQKKDFPLYFKNVI